MPTKFEWNVAKLEGIADEPCQCEKDGDDRCRACIASTTLNRMATDAYDTLDGLEP